MARALWKGQVLAESNSTEQVEGNTYFPMDSVRKEYFRDSDHHSVCPWKGTANYFDVVVEGDVNANAAWYYPEAKEKAKHIENYVAFWNGVQVES